jgi:transglutaminase-like putative cysteine protease
MGFSVMDVSPGSYTAKTIKEMHKLVKAAKTDPEFRRLALWLTRDGDRSRDWKNYSAELENAFARLRKVVTYRRDPYQVEWIQSPWRTLRDGAGDCDDLSILIASVMGATGAKYRFLTFKANPRRPADWSHVLTEILVPKKGWVAADLSVAAPLGFRPRGYVEKGWAEPTY